MSLNKVVLIGRPTKDPELKFSTNGIAITSFTIAVDRNYTNQSGKREADFIPVRVFRKAAENVANYVTKGNLIAVSGSIKTGSYDKDGQKVYTTEVIADNVQFLESKKGNQQPANNEKKQGTEKVGDVDFTPVDNPDDIPF
jgi:single-strand DNA-binding protein